MAAIRFVDIVDETGFALIPPCGDPGFDHRSCDYWEDGDRGSKAARASWMEPGASGPESRPGAGGLASRPDAHASRPDAPPSRPDARTPQRAPANPFLAELSARPTTANPFATGRPATPRFAADEPDDAPIANPFAPPPPVRPNVPDQAPRKLRLLVRGLGIAGSYAKVMLRDEIPAAYAQFGPLTAYPRAQRTRDLYPALPDAPLPAVITCIATTAQARGEGLAKALVAAVCEDLTARGFTAVETYPEIGARPDATSAATPAFWESVGFARAIDDERFPVMRRELA